MFSGQARVFQGSADRERGYLGDGCLPYLLVYDVAPLDENDPLNGYVWDLSKVPDVDSGLGSAVPKKGIALSELMKAANKKT